MIREARQSDGAGRTGHFDYWLLGFALLLAGFGLMMVYSASGIMAERFYANKYHFFIRQSVFATLGLGVMAFCALMPRRFFYGLNYVWLLGSLALLLMTIFPPFATVINGARRWLRVGPVAIQPLELAKIALVFYLAYFFSTKQTLVKSFSVGFLPPFVVTGLFCLILLIQPDFGGAFTLVMILFLMCLVGGTRLFYLFMAALLAACGAAALVIHSSYRAKRWLVFLNPFEDAKGKGYQLVQSLYALGSGEWFGAGLGAGRQKLFFLPEAHNDFIMAVVGEELGFLGVSLVFMGLGVILWRAFRIALAQESMQDRFTAFGMALILGLGFILNLAVVTGTVPPKGVAMPFMSYGGSNLIVSFICVGMLLNLSRSARGRG